MSGSILELVTAIAAEMAGIWQLDRRPADWPTQFVRSKDGRHGFGFRFEKGRLLIWGVLPSQDSAGRQHEIGERPFITVAMKKGPKEIAIDIFRRLWPRYSEACKKAEAKMANINSALILEKAALQYLREQAGDFAHPPGIERTCFQVYSDEMDRYGYVRVSGEKVHLELQSLDLKTAGEILKLFVARSS